ncbi:UNVERIFIED_CONTAM: hypothetical protein FKN15_025462 [Acipenser sinensis]
MTFAAATVSAQEQGQQRAKGGSHGGRLTVPGWLLRPKQSCDRPAACGCGLLTFPPTLCSQQLPLLGLRPPNFLE